jgi:hypothetical protein
MFFQKYKGLIIGIIGGIMTVISFLYFQDLDFIYRTGLKIFSVSLIVIGGIIVENSNHYDKNKENNNL